MNNKQYFYLQGLLHEYIQDKVFGREDVELFNKVRRLAKKHQRLAEMSCNGVGYVNGAMHYNGTIDEYAKRTYGAGVQSAYINDDETVFDAESDKVQDKIKDICFKLGLDVEFQGDPRGNTVKVYYKRNYIPLEV